MSIGIILAGGDGSRLKVEHANKTSLPFNGKPLIQYGVELLEPITDGLIIVVGAYPETVKAVVSSDKALYALQEQRLGTGHAVRIGMDKLEEVGVHPQTVLVGYGDHMMFYTKEIIETMKKTHEKQQAAITLISTDYDDPDMLAWGRIIRNSDGSVREIIEQNDATEEQKKIQELNTGFYCFDYTFLRMFISHLPISPHSGEYYVTDLVKIARDNRQKVIAYEVPFKYVGIGINTREQLSKSESLHQSLKD